MGGAVLPNSAVPLALLKIAAVKDQIISTLTLMDADLSKHNQWNNSCMWRNQKQQVAEVEKFAREIKAWWNVSSQIVNL